MVGVGGEGWGFGVGVRGWGGGHLPLNSAIREHGAASDDQPETTQARVDPAELLAVRRRRGFVARFPFVRLERGAREMRRR